MSDIEELSNNLSWSQHDPIFEYEKLVANINLTFEEIEKIGPDFVKKAKTVYRKITTRFSEEELPDLFFLISKLNSETDFKKQVNYIKTIDKLLQSYVLEDME